MLANKTPTKAMGSNFFGYQKNQRKELVIIYTRLVGGFNPFEKY